MNNNHIISLARGPVPEVCKHYYADLYDREDQFPVKNSMYANLGGIITEQEKTIYTASEYLSFRWTLFRNKLGQYKSKRPNLEPGLIWLR